jgi:Mg-chelatase subunit ChlD
MFKAIDRTPWIHGNTNTADALRELRTVMFTTKHGDRPEAENVAIVMTDGVSNIEHWRTVPEADECR